MSSHEEYIIEDVINLNAIAALKLEDRKAVIKSLTEESVLAMAKKHWTKVLGLESTASDQEIKNAYRKLARAFHPDRLKDESSELDALFKIICNAYTIAIDSERKTMAHEDIVIEKTKLSNEEKHDFEEFIRTIIKAMNPDKTDVEFHFHDHGVSIGSENFSETDLSLKEAMLIIDTIGRLLQENMGTELGARSLGLGDVGKSTFAYIKRNNDPYKIGKKNLMNPITGEQKHTAYFSNEFLKRYLAVFLEDKEEVSKLVKSLAEPAVLARAINANIRGFLPKLHSLSTMFTPEVCRVSIDKEGSISLEFIITETMDEKKKFAQYLYQSTSIDIRELLGSENHLIRVPEERWKGAIETAADFINDAISEKRQIIALRRSIQKEKPMSDFEEALCNVLTLPAIAKQQLCDDLIEYHQSFDVNRIMKVLGALKEEISMEQATKLFEKLVSYPAAHELVNYLLNNFSIDAAPDRQHSDYPWSPYYKFFNQFEKRFMDVERTLSIPQKDISAYYNMSPQEVAELKDKPALEQLRTLHPEIYNDLAAMAKAIIPAFGKGYPTRDYKGRTINELILRNSKLAALYNDFLDDCELSDYKIYPEVVDKKDANKQKETERLKSDSEPVRPEAKPRIAFETLKNKIPVPEPSEYMATVDKFIDEAEKVRAHLEKLEEFVEKIEEKVGSFSRYKTVTGPGQDISFASKPAQKVLNQLGATDDATAPLTALKSQEELDPNFVGDITIAAFDGSKETLTITQERLQRLLLSATIYINTDIFPQDQYLEIVGKLAPQTKEKAPNGEYWQNLAVGVCHCQEIDLLMAQEINEEGKALAKPRTGTIDDSAEPILLLSSPALNCAYGTAKDMAPNKQKYYISAMYRNLFNAAQSRGRDYIVMPAAGLGVYGGNADIYFDCLMAVAREYPNLNIIYHPAQFGEQFDAYAHNGAPENVTRASKDVVFIADELVKQGHSCALHNPSDSDVVYGIYDVGEYWKIGRGSGYVGEEHIGAMSTAPLNSRGLNPMVYHNVEERSMEPEAYHKLTAIKQAVAKAQQNYNGWYEGDKTSSSTRAQLANHLFTKVRHSKKGQKRAIAFNQKIQNRFPEDPFDENKINELVETIVGEINQVLGDKKTRYHTHSFSSFLLDELLKIDENLEESTWSNQFELASKNLRYSRKS